MSVLALRWTELPQSTRDDLAKRGLVRTRFEQLDADTQLCLLAIRCALSRAELWHFVQHDDESGSGCLNFRATDVSALRAAIDSTAGFGPVRGTSRWTARQIGARGALHFKHFDGWPPDKVQAHIDPIGARPSWWWWLLPIVPLGLLLAHWIKGAGYQNGDRVARSVGLPNPCQIDPLDAN